MAEPYIATVLDTLKTGKLSVRDACRILRHAIAPEVGVGAPSGAMRRITAQFDGILSAYAAHDIDRVPAEDAITRIFTLAAQRDFRTMMTVENLAADTAPTM